MTAQEVSPVGDRSSSAGGPVSVASGRAAEPSLRARLPVTELSWDFGMTRIGPMRAVVVLPEREPDERFPVLIAMHGRGEALKGPERGSRGWVDDYALRRAIDRLSHPPLKSADFEGFVSAERLAALNESLAREPFGGLIVVCPYTPDMLGGDQPFATAHLLATFLVETLLPRVYRETPAIGTPASTGIDGVSLGGRAALTTGLLRPEAFGAVSTLQPAFDVRDAAEITARARTAREKNSALRLRLLTSDGDYFLRSTRAIGAALGRAGIAHDFLLAVGPHDYPFNRGPGAIEMLVYHDRVLRGKPAP